MQDLKAGHVLGGTPIKLQVMQIVGAVIGALVMAPVLNVMASVASGVFKGGLPWDMVAIGAGIAIAVIAIDLQLERRRSEFRMPVMAFAVGIYLPFELSVPILLGGLLAWAMTRHFARAGVVGAQREERERNGLLFSAGLITGESLMGIGLALAIYIAKDKNALSLDVVHTKLLELPGLALLALVGWLLYRASTRDTSRR
jgi:uncharacterized oligopeptide transporter (OPT) family protein